jgi:hypothetical protein
MMAKTGIHFWETAVWGKKKVLVNGFHETKDMFGFGVHGILIGTEARHDVEIGNKWSYMTDAEKDKWKENAKKEIINKLSPPNQKVQ